MYIRHSNVSVPARLGRYILLGQGENVPHLGDLVLHQIFVGVSDLHLTDERGGSYIVVAVIYQAVWL